MIPDTEDHIHELAMYYIRLRQEGAFKADPWLMQTVVQQAADPGLVLEEVDQIDRAAKMARNRKRAKTRNK